MLVREASEVCLFRNSNLHDTEEEVRDQTQKLDERKPKLGFAECLDAKQLESQKRELISDRLTSILSSIRLKPSGSLFTHPKDQKVSVQRHLVAPEHHDARNDIVFIRQDAKPDDEVVPADSDTEGLINEAVAKGGKGAARGVQSGQLAQALHDGESEDADDAESDDQRGGTARRQRAAGADKKTRADDAGEGHHAEMARLEAALDTTVRVNGLEVIRLVGARPEAALAVVCEDAIFVVAIITAGSNWVRHVAGVVMREERGERRGEKSSGLLVSRTETIFSFNQDNKQRRTSGHSNKHNLQCPQRGWRYERDAEIL